MNPNQIAEVVHRLVARCEEAGVLDDSLRAAADAAKHELLRPLSAEEAQGLADLAEAAHDYAAETAHMN